MTAVTARGLLPLAAVLVIAASASASACGGTSGRFTWENGQCAVSLSGSGADAELDSLGVTVVLASIDDETATLEIFGLDGAPD